MLEDVWEDVSEYARQQCAGYGNRQEKIDTLRDILAGITSGTRNRTDFIKGVYCAWLLEKSDQELEKMLLYSSEGSFPFCENSIKDSPLRLKYYFPYER